ncbi:unnamed protein product [Paramecium primaurelia]|uniref:Protein kinase domain-containing protein n=1 Tax=Paramecium primaurelia TaxID=5886 RepID=A0A8S1PXT6_PARPR|nr:unnamed protein product [Paramecium primaurelia]CAD8108089.1 unnamed protein product [Paramecium primaurelia]
MSQTSLSKQTQFKDNYIILTDEYYGEGCFGQVYSCRKIDNTDPTIYCVKIIPINQEIHNSTQQSEIEDIIKTTISELDKNSPYQINLVQIFDIFYEGYFIYIVMEKCDEDLQIEFDKMNENNEWYTEEQVLDLIQQIITGQHQLHYLKIIHSDIKPENILIKYENKGQVNERKMYKISDFGIGRLIKQLTKKNDLIRTGTPNYSAPQMFENHIATEKSDIFSLGVLFYQICHKSQLPYDCSSMQKRYQSLQNLKTNSFQAPPLPYNKGNIFNNLIQRMIVYREDERIQFQDIIHHSVMKAQGIEDTVVFNNESTSFQSEKLYDKSQYLEKRRVASILSRLKRLQRLLELFYNRFKLCNYFITQINNDENFLQLKLNLYLIAFYQLQYALALIYIRPFEMHPNTIQENDILILIDKLSEIQNTIKNFQAEDVTKYKYLENQIQEEYHKFKKQFYSFSNILHSKFINKTSFEDCQFFHKALMSKIKLQVLVSNITKLKKIMSGMLSEDLQDLLNQIIKLETLFPVSTYKSDIDLTLLFSIKIQQTNA